MSEDNDPYEPVPSEELTSELSTFEEDRSEDERSDREFFEDFVLGFLDGEEPVQETWDEFYLTETVDVIEDELGLRHPDEVSFLEYPTGHQMVYDAITQLMEDNEIYRKLDESFEEKEKPSLPMMLLKLPIKLPQAAATYFWMRKKINFQAERVMGVHDVNIASQAGFPMTLNEEVIGYVPDNIRDFAQDQDIGPEAAEQYVKTHEGIHVVQSHNFPGVRQRKSELINESIDIQQQSIPDDVEEELNAIMSVVEGHAEFFTNKIAQERYQLDIDRDTSIKQDILYRIFGYKKKRDQYSEGSDFIQELYNIGGTSLANSALRSPPESMQEIRNPQEWI